MKPTADFSHFEALDFRVGRVVQVEDAETRKQLYRVTVDFGPEIGTKVSCAGYCNYEKDELMGRLVVAVINFAPKKMGPETSEVFILGAVSEGGEAVFVTPESEVPLGVVVV
jgi:tRNA-binding protein